MPTLSHSTTKIKHSKQFEQLTSKIQALENQMNVTYNEQRNEIDRHC